jgi:hypothetical protein
MVIFVHMLPNTDNVPGEHVCHPLCCANAVDLKLSEVISGFVFHIIVNLNLSICKNVVSLTNKLELDLVIIIRRVKKCINISTAAIIATYQQS